MTCEELDWQGGIKGESESNIQFSEEAWTKCTYLDIHTQRKGKTYGEYNYVKLEEQALIGYIL